METKKLYGAIRQTINHSMSIDCPQEPITILDSQTAIIPVNFREKDGVLYKTKITIVLSLPIVLQHPIIKQLPNSTEESISDINDCPNYLFIINVAESLIRIHEVLAGQCLIEYFYDTEESIDENGELSAFIYNSKFSNSLN